MEKEEKRDKFNTIAASVTRSFLLPFLFLFFFFLSLYMVIIEVGFVVERDLTTSPPLLSPLPFFFCRDRLSAKKRESRAQTSTEKQPASVPHPFFFFLLEEEGGG